MEMLEMKSMVTKMKNVFKGHISKLNTAKGIISDLDNTSAEIILTEIQREKKRAGRKTEDPRDKGQYQTIQHICNEISEGEERTGWKKYLNK